ncbi:MAG: methyltransferase family protein [Gaiellaceae bacterium]
MSVVAFAMRRPVATRVATSAPVAVLWLLFAVSNFAQWRATHEPIGLGATALELVVATLFVVRRSPWLVSRSPLAWAAAVIGTFGVLAARPAYDPIGGFEWLYGGLQVAGAIFAGVALLSLGRSFGLVAANRGVRTGGPYRCVRHPVYSGYILTYAGYLLENPSLRNACLFAVVLVFQIVRIVEEERTLAGDPAYQAYRRRVRGRVVPYVL